MTVYKEDSATYFYCSLLIWQLRLNKASNRSRLELGRPGSELIIICPLTGSTNRVGVKFDATLDLKGDSCNFPNMREKSVLVLRLRRGQCNLPKKNCWPNILLWMWSNPMIPSRRPEVIKQKIRKSVFFNFSKQLI